MYKIFGYDDDCIDFDISLDSLVAVFKLLQSNRFMLSVVFTEGISDLVLDTIREKAFWI